MDDVMIKVKKDLVLIFFMGALYLVLEGIWRGWTNISMVVVGGVCGYLVGQLNERPAFYNQQMWMQCLLGTIIVLLVEFVSGMILNVYFHLGIWDYSDVWGNIYGQICIPYAFLWFLLMPLAIYMDDYLRHRFFMEEKPQGLLENYKSLFGR